MEELKFKIKKIILPYLIISIVIIFCYSSFYQYIVLEYDVFNKIEWKYAFTIEQQKLFSKMLFCLPVYLLMKPRVGCLRGYRSRIDVQILMAMGVFLLILFYSEPQEKLLEPSGTLSLGFIQEYKGFFYFYILFLVLLVLRILYSDLKPDSFSNKKHKSDQTIKNAGSFFLSALFVGFYLLCAILFVLVFSGSFMGVMHAYKTREYSLIIWMFITFMMSGAFLYVLLKGYKLPLDISELKAAADSGVEQHKTYQFKDFPNLIGALSKQNNKDSFLVFMFGDNEKHNGLNIQLSIDKNGIGLDWVLVAEANKRDKDLFIDTVHKFGYKCEEKKGLWAKYLRITESDDFVALAKAIIIDMYDEDESTIFDVVIEGFEYDA